MSSPDLSSGPASRPVSSFDPHVLDDATVESVRVPPLSADTLDALPSEHRTAVKRLHRMVEAAVATIQTLRAQNERLEQTIADLQRRPEVPEDATVVTLDAPPEALRDQIRSFIRLIDQYLEAGDGTSDAPPVPLSLPRSAAYDGASQDEAA